MCSAEQKQACQRLPQAGKEDCQCPLAIVSQSLLELLTFAGGLSVPGTIRAGASVLHTKGLSPFAQLSDLDTPEEAELFVYEVTRLFPMVQGFPYWANDGPGGAPHRHMAHMNHALRDPEVWGCDSHKFTLKSKALYDEKHIGFADGAITDGYDWRDLRKSGACVGKVQCARRMCPAKQLALYTARAFFEEYAKGNWHTKTLPVVKGYPVFFDGFTTQKLKCAAGDMKEIKFRDTHTSCASLPSCPQGWTQLGVTDNWGCKDAVLCGGCCTAATKQLSGWFCGTCQSGWVETAKKSSWSWRGRSCSVTCTGCDGTWSGSYGHAAARGAESEEGDSSAHNAVAMACALLGSAVAGAALVVLRRRRQLRDDSAKAAEERGCYSALNDGSADAKGCAPSTVDV